MHNLFVIIWRIIISKENVRAIIEKDGRYFFVKNNSIGAFYFLLGGRIENGEGLEEALRREIKEETGKDAEIGNLVAVHRIKHEDSYLPSSYIFHVKNASDFENIDLSLTSHGEEEIEEFGFIDITTKERILPEELREILPELLEENFNGNCRIIESNHFDA